jgi:hypothetical protein
LSGERFSNSPQALAAVLRRADRPDRYQEAGGFSFSFGRKSQAEVALYLPILGDVDAGLLPYRRWMRSSTAQ